jgi:hypothetical protein
MKSLTRTALRQELLPVVLAWVLLNGALVGTWALSLNLSELLPDLLYSLVLANAVMLALLLVRALKAVRRTAWLASLSVPPVAVDDLSERVVPYDWMLRFVDDRDQQHGQAAERVADRVTDDVEFFGAWIHELKTPVSVLRLLTERGDQVDTAEVERQLNRLEQHISRAMYHLRSSSLSGDMMITPVALGPLVQERIRGMARTFIAKRISIDVTGEFGEVSSDKKWLAFVLDQILQNSARYTGDEGSLAVIGRITDEGPMVEIHDNGVGIPAEDLPRVFERSFTGTRGREFGSSTGLGLYLARKMMGRLGHRIEVHSPSDHWEEPAGTTVMLSFPNWEQTTNLTHS